MMSNKPPKTGADKDRLIHRTPSRLLVILPVGAEFGAFCKETGRLIAGGVTEYDALKRAGRLGWKLAPGP